LEDLSDASFLGKLLVQPANVRLDWKVIARYKHSGLFGLIISNEGKKFFNIDHRTTQTLIEAGPYPQGDSRLLPELFGAVVEQFYLVIDSFRLLALAIPKSVERNQV
jgi:hypothetical protein